MSEIIRLIRAGEQDAQKVLILYRECAKHSAFTHWDEEYPGIQMINSDINDGALYMMISEGELLGAVSLMKTDDIEQLGLPFTGQKPLVLVRLCVSPRLQGRHMGKRLMELAHVRMRELGALSSHLLCDEGNPVTNKLYQGLGYQAIAPVSLYGGQFIAYEKRL